MLKSDKGYGENKAEEGDGIVRWGDESILSTVIREGFTEKVSFKPRLEGGQRASHLSVWEKKDLGREAHRCRVTEAWVCLECSRKIRVPVYLKQNDRKGEDWAMRSKVKLGRGRQTIYGPVSHYEEFDYFDYFSIGV